MTISIQNLTINYARTGSGPAVLILHGWGVEHSSYTPIIELLARSYTVFAPDLPGFGGSGEPPEPWGAEEYASFVLAFCAAADCRPVAAIGHSNGGRILLQLTGAMNNALGLKKLILTGSVGLKVQHSLGYYIKIYSYKLGKRLLRPFPQTLARFQAGRGSADYRQASPVMRGTMSRLIKTDLTWALPRITVPTLLLWGREDTAAPYAHALLMERLIPDAGLVPLDGGHWAMLEQWGVTAAALSSFLEVPRA